MPGTYINNVTRQVANPGVKDVPMEDGKHFRNGMIQGAIITAILCEKEGVANLHDVVNKRPQNGIL